MGEEPQARNREGDRTGCKILPNMSTSSGFWGWEDGGGGWAKRAPSSGRSIQVLGRTVFWGRGQNNDWSLHLATAFYSTLPRINCPKTSSITKKGNHKNTRGQPLYRTSSAIFPSSGDRVAGRGGVGGAQALTNCSGQLRCVVWGPLPTLSSEELPESLTSLGVIVLGGTPSAACSGALLICSTLGAFKVVYDQYANCPWH